MNNGIIQRYRQYSLKILQGLAKLVGGLATLYFIGGVLYFVGNSNPSPYFRVFEWWGGWEQIAFLVGFFLFSRHCYMMGISKAQEKSGA